MAKFSSKIIPATTFSKSVKGSVNHNETKMQKIIFIAYKSDSAGYTHNVIIGKEVHL